MKRAGVGRRTKQYNPKKKLTHTGSFIKSGAVHLIQESLDGLCKYSAGDQSGDVSKAVELIHATGPRKRSEFQKDIWVMRKKLYGPSGRKDGGAVPF